jgi:hypothetical protein
MLSLERARCIRRRLWFTAEASDPISTVALRTPRLPAGNSVRREGVVDMAKNAPYGDGRRVGAVRGRSQTQTPSGKWVKRDTATGRFMDVKSDGTPFKGVRRER